MEDDRSFARLQEEHYKAFHESRERIEKWERFQGDYEALQARLYSLPDKLTHDIMVPFGRFGFIPGHMYHTNEVMVLLGDNWFAKRTAKQALEIAERRKQYVAKKLDEERQQMTDWQARLGFTEEMRTSRQEHEGVVEIKEELGSEEKTEASTERHWRARRPKHQTPPPRPAFGKTPSKPLGAKEADQALWDRLDQLEREEEENREREEDEYNEGEDGHGSREREGVADHSSGQEGARVILEREVRETTSTQGVFDVRGSEEARATGSSPLRITVKHSCPDNQLSGASEVSVPSSSDPVVVSGGPLFTSPGDIFRHRSKPQGSRGSEGVEAEGRVQWEEEELGGRDSADKCVKWAPVLESHQSPPPPPGELVEGGGNEERPVDAAPTTQAFSGQVVERSAPSSDATSVKDEAPQTPKVSKFKASRKRS